MAATAAGAAGTEPVRRAAPAPRARRGARWGTLAAALLPVAGLFLLRWGADAALPAALAGLLAALALMAPLGAFGARGSRALVLVPLAALLAGAVHGLLEADAARGAAASALLLGVGAATGGLAAVGRRVGAPDVPAGAVAAGVLWVAMLGLLWADPVAAALPRARRHGFRQAVLHVDPALAAAYGAAGHDRLRDPSVYFAVPLASSLVEAPGAFWTGATWLGVGLLAGAASVLVGGGWRGRAGAAGIDGSEGARGGRAGARSPSPAPPP
jgi:hypothetical protein